MSGERFPVGAAYQEDYCEIIGKRFELNDGNRPIDPELERHLWTAVLSVCRAYASSENLDQHLEPREPFPTEVANHIGSVIEELLTGKMPETWKAVTQSRPPFYSPLVEDAICKAVRYVDLANAKLIHDRSPVKSVCEKFGIKRRTWKDWRKRVGTSQTPPKKFYPHLRDDTVKQTELAQKLLDRAAAMYRRNGRPDYPEKGRVRLTSLIRHT